MKFLCDVHISRKLSKFLEEHGHTSIHINDILDKWTTKDSAITKHADNEDLILITKDQDFRISHLITQKPNKLIKINLGNISNTALIETFENHLDWINEVNSSTESFMIEVFKNDLWVVTR